VVDGVWGGQGGYPKVDNMRVSNMAVELPLDVLLGPTFDGLDVITGPGEHEANAKAFEIWSLLLNHGYRLTATGSSDACFDRPGGAIPGTPRTYAYVPGKFSVSEAARAMANGATFVTTGPLLLATIDGKPPGTVFAADKKQRVLSVEAWKSGKESNGLRRLEILRNGQVWQDIALADPTAFIRTNVPIQQLKTGWYCVRAFGEDPRKQVAVTGAFYFADKSLKPPAPVTPRLRAQIVDAQTGTLVPGTLTEMFFSGTIGRMGKRHMLKTGAAQLSIPGTVRLRAEASGYRPLILSPVLDNPELIQAITTFQDSDLTDWRTFEKLRNKLTSIHVVFRMQRTSDLGKSSAVDFELLNN
jgi:hypothetical protein